MQARSWVQRRWQAMGTIVVSLAAVTILRLYFGDPALGISVLSVVPISLAAFAFGRSGAIVVATVSLILFLVIASSDLTGSRLVAAGATRGAAFVGLALLLSYLLDRQDRLGRRIAEQGHQLEELRVLREALVPPNVPEVAGMRLASCYVPAEGMVSGDFFFVAPDEAGVTVAIGDVVGHGLPAARRSAFVRTVMAALAEEVADPSELLRLANAALLRQRETSEFVTAACLRLSPKEGRLAWATAGHPPPWDLDRGRALSSTEGGLPLGVERDLRASTNHQELGAGAGLLLYTDGLVEARHALAGEARPLFGEEAARAELLRHRGESPSEIVGALSRAALEFAGPELADDLTLLALRLGP